MSLLRKRYDMIALLLQAALKVHHNLPKAIITLNSPEAIIAGDLLCGRLAKRSFFYFLPPAEGSIADVSRALYSFGEMPTVLLKTDEK